MINSLYRMVNKYLGVSGLSFSAYCSWLRLRLMSGNLFSAENLEAATDIIQIDPFATEDLLEQQWLSEWVIE